MQQCPQSTCPEHGTTGGAYGHERIVRVSPHSFHLGKRIAADSTFATKADAPALLAGVETGLNRTKSDFEELFDGDVEREALSLRTTTMLSHAVDKPTNPPTTNRQEPIVIEMHRARTATIAISICAAAMGASCGGSDGSAGTDPATLPSVGELSTEPSTTVGAPTTTTPTTTTEQAPTTAPALATTTSAATTSSTAVTVASTTTTAAAPVAPHYCEPTGPLPGSAVLDYSLTLDMMDDGTADDLIEAYEVDGRSRLRLTTGGSVVSEIINPAIDGFYRPLGVAPALPGDSAELFAVIGEGSAAAEIGVFGIDFGDCLFSYTHTGTSDDFTMLIRPASSVRSGAFCFDGGIGLFSAEQRSDGKWDASSAAYVIATPWTLQYLGNSDDYSEGLDESELSVFEFDCLGLSL